MLLLPFGNMETWEWAEVKRQMELTGTGPRTEVPEIIQTPVNARSPSDELSVIEELFYTVQSMVFADYEDLDKGVVSSTSSMLCFITRS